jgi:hypothetical protein
VVNEERKKKEDPSRGKPNRGFSNFFTNFTSDNSDSGKSETDSEKPWQDNVNYGVKLGYQVIEEHIQQGQRVAQEVNNRTYEAESLNNDMQEIVERTQRFISEIAQLSMSSMESMSQSFPNMGTGSASEEGAAKANGKDAPNLDQAKVTIVMSSRRALEVSVDLLGASEDMVIDHLHQADISKPPLTDVKLLHIMDHEFKFHINVPDEHPPGLYYGVVYRSSNRKPCGTISVNIPE